MVVEDEHFPAFRRYSRPWQVRPWQRQQVIKLNAPAMTDARFVLTLDPDVLARKPVTRELLLPGGRALLEPEPRSVHPRWWRDSADLLDVEPALERPGMNVTPAVLSTAVLGELQRRLEEVGGRPWMDILLTSYCDWTEYTLYLLAAERAGLVEREHLWARRPVRPRAPPRPPCAQRLGRRRARPRRRRAALRRRRPWAVRGGAEQQRPVRGRRRRGRRGPVRDPSHAGGRPGARSRTRSQLGERVRVASRLAAQGIFRARRGLRRVLP